MNHIMDHIGIYINDNSKRIPYKRMLYDKGIPNYLPANPDGISKDLQVDQILFLPIEMEIFNSDRTHYHVGYRYLFSSVEHHTISLSKDPNILGMTQIQISSSVQRIRYKIIDKLDIVIDKICDPLYPPRIFNIESPTKDVSNQILQLTTNMINQLNAWYIDKNV